MKIYRMKREVASNIVERGVAERMRLRENFEKENDKLQQEHELIRKALMEHKEKVSSILILHFYFYYSYLLI